MKANHLTLNQFNKNNIRLSTVVQLLHNFKHYDQKQANGSDSSSAKIVSRLLLVESVS